MTANFDHRFLQVLRRPHVWDGMLVGRCPMDQLKCRRCLASRATRQRPDPSCSSANMPKPPQTTMAAAPVRFTPPGVRKPTTEAAKHFVRRWMPSAPSPPFPACRRGPRVRACLAPQLDFRRCCNSRNGAGNTRHEYNKFTTLCIAFPSSMNVLCTNVQKAHLRLGVLLRVTEDQVVLPGSRDARFPNDSRAAREHHQFGEDRSLWEHRRLRQRPRGDG